MYLVVNRAGSWCQYQVLVLLEIIYLNYIHIFLEQYMSLTAFLQDSWRKLS